MYNWWQLRTSYNLDNCTYTNIRIHTHTHLCTLMAVTDISTFTQTKTIHLTMNLELASLEGAYLSQDSDSCYFNE